MKKTIKHFAVIVLAAVMVFGLFTVTAKAEPINGSDDLINWTIFGQYYNPNNISLDKNDSNSSGTMHDYSTNNPAPWAEYKDVIELVDFRYLHYAGSYSFYEFSKLTTINSFGYMESIGDRAFLGCSSLSKMGAFDLKTIGNYSFYGCKSLTYLPITSVTSIGKAAFQNCTGLTYVNIPTGLTEIKDWTFKGCKNLQWVSIPSNVTSIASTAFDGCTNLKLFLVEAGSAAETFAKDNNYPYVSAAWDSSTGTLTLSGNSDLPDLDYESDDGVFWNKYRSSAKKIVVKKGITGIGDSSFSGFTKVTKISLPQGLTRIGKYAFESDKSLTAVSIPADVELLDEYCFSGCTSLADITIPHTVQTVKNYAFYDCKKLETVNFDGNTLEEGAFESCPVKTVVIGDNVSAIPDKAFYGRPVTSLTIGSNVTSIGKEAFYGAAFTSLTIGNSVKTIGENAFRGCADLTSLTIGDSVKTIKGGAFYYCRKLSSLKLGSSVKTIGKSAFEYCGSLKKTTIPASVTTLGDCSFAGTGLASVTVPAAVTSIGQYALGYDAYDDEDYEQGFYTYYELAPGFKMYVYPGSEAEIYAQNNGISYVVLGPPEFLVQPKNIKTTAGTEVSIAVKCNNAVSYQWWVWDTNSWSKTDSSWTGYNTRKLTFVPTAEMDGWRFLCKVKGTDGTYQKSDWVSVTILKPANIVVQPKSVSAEAGTKVKFALKAENAKAYRWQYNDGSGWQNVPSNFDGYNTRILSLKATKSRNGWKFRCKVKGQDGVWIKSSTVKLTVK